MSYWLFGWISFCIMVVAATALVILKHGLKIRQPAVPYLKIITGVTFLAALMLFIPVCYDWKHWADPHTYLRPFLLALQKAVQIFLLGIDFKEIEEHVPTEPETFRVLYCLYAMAMCVFAPALTFTNILVLFKNLTGQLKIRLCIRKPIYIMSELNAASITMAETIALQYEEKSGPKPLIVFTDVFFQNEEADYELLLEARRIHAICLKKDVSHIRYSRLSKSIEFFLIGEDETENIRQALLLNNYFQEIAKKRCKRFPCIRISVFSSDPTADAILDKLTFADKLLSKDFKDWLSTDPQTVVYSSEADWKAKWDIKEPGKKKNKKYSIHGDFSVRRIDPVDILAQNVLTYCDYADYKAIQEAANQTGTISITILGLGHHGSHFLKTAIWFYQRYGIRLEFNVFDLGTENGNPVKRLEHECPELISKNHAQLDGDSQHSIRFFTGVDCFSSEFDDLFLYDERTRLSKTNLVFIALGDDTLNIRAAGAVETLFARIRIRENHAGTLPFIYTVVYEDKKASNLNMQTKPAPSANKKAPDTPIRYVGTMGSRFSYQVIEKIKVLEAEAFWHHLDWVRKSGYLRECYLIAQRGTQNQTLNVSMEACKKFHSTLSREWAEKERKNPNDTSRKDFLQDDINGDQLIKEATRYMNQSYFRSSSLSMALHKNALAQISQIKDSCKTNPLCTCRDCTNRRKTEHLRWNAYMRVLGYCYHPETKSHTAKLHYDLCAWDALSIREQYND